MKKIQNIVLFLIILATVCVATNMVAMDNSQNSQSVKFQVSKKNLRLFNIFKANIITVKPEAHKIESKKTQKSQARKKKIQASPERNAMIFERLLHQAEDQLHDRNKIADQNYAEKAGWKMKDTLKEQHLRLKQ